jgi:DNA-binding NtrC family response regulator
MSSQKTPNILVVEDQLNWRRLLKVWLNKEFHLAFCTNRSEVIFALKNGYYDVVIMDLGLPDPKEGIEITQEIMKQHNDCKIIVVSAYTDRELLLKVQNSGVYAVFQKTENLEFELPVLVKKAYELLILERENRYLSKQLKISGEDFSVLGSSETARNLHETAKNVSSSDLPVLIKGPTGSGKNYLARYIHQLSPRANKPFVTINCANLSPSLAENELFGHVRGAFTGADRSAKGKFKAADGGTVLLDEVGDLSLSIQAKLLQVIEERSFFPLGGRDKIEVDIRILACTTHDLTEEVENENFRKDLYFRLAGFLINIPTISERKEDIPVYFDYFVRTVCTKENIPTPEIDQQIYDILEKMTWKGNLRELKNLITNILVFHPQKITVQDILSKQNNEKSSIISKSLQRDYSLQEMSALYAQELYKKYQKKGIIAGILNIDHKTLNRYLKMKVGP